MVETAVKGVSHSRVALIQSHAFFVILLPLTISDFFLSVSVAPGLQQQAVLDAVEPASNNRAGLDEGRNQGVDNGAGGKSICPSAVAESIHLLAKLTIYLSIGLQLLQLTSGLWRTLRSATGFILPTVTTRERTATAAHTRSRL